jgi:methylated-DNA-protein-cysteine methyltransferase related protein
MSNFYTEVYEIAKRIPIGKVTSYGRIAALLGRPRAARAVGYALHSLEKDSLSEIPWQRVINSQGKISFKGDVFRANLQKQILEEEGIIFGQNGAIDWKIFGWP